MDEAGDSTFPNWPEFRRLFAYDNLIGKVLQGRYEVVRRLGAGGMGVVFLARHIHLDKPFALKIISPRFLDEPEIGQRFLLEARAASKIDHPNVVSITDFGPPDEGPAFFVMEHLEGEDLARLLAREGPLPWPRVVPIVAQVARALAAAHRRGVVHRDIKPQNCFRVTRDDDPDFIKVLDFGLAKVLSGTGKSAWTVGGSPGYIAPEIFRGGRTDHRVDIFALGVLMHTLLFGRLPAQAPEDAALPPGAAAPRPEDVPAQLRAIVERAAHEDPEQRFATAEALLAALEAGRAALAGSAVPKDMSARAGPRRRGWIAAAALGGLAVAVALVRGVGAGGGAGAGPGPEDSSAGAVLSDSKGAGGRAAAGGTPVASDSEPSGAGGPAATGAASVPSDSKARDPALGAGGAAPDGETRDAGPVPAGAGPGPSGTSPVSSDSGAVGPGPSDTSPVPSDSGAAGPGPSDTSPVPADTHTAPAGPGPSDRPRPRAPAFDEAAARDLLQRQGAGLAACKAGSSFGGVATAVRLTGVVRVTARGRATVELPAGYDVNACIASLVARLQFRPSAAGGSFTHVFLL